MPTNLKREKNVAATGRERPLNIRPSLLPSPQSAKPRALFQLGAVVQSRGLVQQRLREWPCRMREDHARRPEISDRPLPALLSGVSGQKLNDDHESTEGSCTVASTEWGEAPASDWHQVPDCEPFRLGRLVVAPRPPTRGGYHFARHPLSQK